MTDAMSSAMTSAATDLLAPLNAGELTAMRDLARGLPLEQAITARLEALARQDEAEAEKTARAAEGAREAVVADILSGSDAGQAAWQELVRIVEVADHPEAPQAIAIVERLAERNHVPALTTLGVMFEDGKGGKPEDHAQALAFYLRAARAGDFNAMALVGSLYQRGRGVDADLFQALYWYEQCKDQKITARLALLRLWHAGHGGADRLQRLQEEHNLVVSFYEERMASAARGHPLPPLDPFSWISICDYCREFGGAIR